MQRSSFTKIFYDPFSIFNIIMIFIVTAVLTILIGLPIIEFFVLSPAGTSFTDVPDNWLPLLTEPTSVLIILLLQNSLFAILIYVRVIKFGGYTTRDLGIKVDNYSYLIPVGLLIGAIVLLLNVGISFTLEQAGYDIDPQFGVPQSGTGLLMILIAGVIMAPIGEELFFRAYLVTAVSERYNNSYAIFFSGLFFAVVHFNSIVIIPLFFVGAILAVIFIRYKSVLPCIIIHAMNNFVAIMLIYYNV